MVCLIFFSKTQEIVRGKERAKIAFGKKGYAIAKKCTLHKSRCEFIEEDGKCISAFGCIPVDPKREGFCWAEPKSPPPVVPVVVPICAEVEPNRPPPDVEVGALRPAM